MSKKEELKQTYLKDVEMAASKSKFGFFNVPPPISAGDQTFQQKKIQRDQNGKPKTQQRNIFSGISASGILKKSFFSYPEYKTGSTYLDPGKADRLKEMQADKKYVDKQVFRPSSLNKTLNSASYEYIPQKQTRKDPKQFRNEDGKVRTQNSNIMSNPSSKIQYKSFSQLKYASQPYDNAHMIKRKQLFEDISKRAENAFKPSSPTKEYFSTNKEKYGTIDIPLKKQKKIDYNIRQHDSNFKPGGSHLSNGVFSYPKNMPGEDLSQKQTKVSHVKNQSEKKQPFRLIKQQKSSKPCPSISLSKMNIMRCLR